MRDLAWKRHRPDDPEAKPQADPPPFEPGIAMKPDDGRELCPEHGQAIGYYGCTACNAGAKWREKQRARRDPI